MMPLVVSSVYLLFQIGNVAAAPPAHPQPSRLVNSDLFRFYSECQHVLEIYDAKGFGARTVS